MHKVPVLLGGLLFLSQATVGELGNAAGAAAGIFADIYVHEAGHAFAAHGIGASASGIYIHVPGSQCTLLCGETSWVLPSSVSPAKQRAPDAAGFAASNLTAEALPHMDDGARSAFGQGFIATNLYSTQDEAAANTVMFIQLRL